MTKIVLISLLLVNSAFATSASWMSMLENVGGTYELIKNTEFQLKGSTNRYLHLNKNTMFFLEDHIALPNIRVQLFKFRYFHPNFPCNFADIETELEIKTTYTEPRKIEIGTQFQKECLLEVFVENKDLRSGNFFRERK